MSPGTGLLAAALGVSVVTVLSAAAAMLAVPAVLALTGHRLGRDARQPAGTAGVSARLARAAARRPALAVLRHAAAASSEHPGPQPAHRRAGRAAAAVRQRRARRVRIGLDGDGRRLDRAFEIVAVTRRGAVTTQARLAALERGQRRLARDPAGRADATLVRLVLLPAALHLAGPLGVVDAGPRLREGSRRRARTRNAIGC